MPVTARLSRKFYDTLGDEVANELVDWLNAVDLSYRQEFRELFQAHFGTLDARMREQEERFERKLEGLKSELLRWMFLFWILTIGIVLAAGRLHG
jgi:hypothetical protein